MTRNVEFDKLLLTYCLYCHFDLLLTWKVPSALTDDLEKQQEKKKADKKKAQKKSKKQKDKVTN